MVYRIALARVGNKWDAEDVFQEVFITYCQKKPEIRDEEHRKAWLIKTTMNLSKKVIASTWRKKVTIDAEVKIANIYEFESKHENDIFAAMSQLADKYKMVLYLFYFEELSTKEIAKVIAVREGTVRMRLSRARDMMKEKLEAARQRGGAM